MKRFLRIPATAVSVIFLLWFLTPLCYGIINPGNLLGIVICLYLIFWCGFNRSYKRLKKRLCRRKVLRVLWKVFNICMTLFALYAVTISGLMAYSAAVPPKESSTAVVLGAQVKPYGPSVLLRQRINAAEGWLKDNPTAAAVVTGGKGSDEIMSEAQCMYECMTEDGVDKRRIYKEDKAKNTQQNIAYSYDIIEKNNLNKSLAVVTDSYHQLRARLIAKKQGISTPIGAVNTTNGFVGIVSYPTFFVREWIAIPAELLK